MRVTPRLVVWQVNDVVVVMRFRKCHTSPSFASNLPIPFSRYLIKHAQVTLKHAQSHSSNQSCGMTANLIIALLAGRPVEHVHGLNNRVLAEFTFDVQQSLLHGLFRTLVRHTMASPLP